MAVRVQEAGARRATRRAPRRRVLGVGASASTVRSRGQSAASSATFSLPAIRQHLWPSSPPVSLPWPCLTLFSPAATKFVLLETTTHTIISELGHLSDVLTSSWRNHPTRPPQGH
ncbi:hypothetical protein BD310DRAFT_369103 [Dichomitus squalens]|uniref:Uncharacterized protein n=1 Tax=Dichomitus squalens TaxID=114155 RepID=A0A4Q9PYQ8_9APHY|nr:hypothetical protein BD310DRAFT_369103 [Dichomitus squalens]